MVNQVSGNRPYANIAAKTYSKADGDKFLNEHPEFKTNSIFETDWGTERYDINPDGTYTVTYTDEAKKGGRAGKPTGSSGTSGAGGTAPLTWEQALELYDTDDDGGLTSGELLAASGHAGDCNYWKDVISPFIDPDRNSCYSNDDALAYVNTLSTDTKTAPQQPTPQAPTPQQPNPPKVDGSGAGAAPQQTPAVNRWLNASQVMLAFRQGYGKEIKDLKPGTPEYLKAYTDALVELKEATDGLAAGNAEATAAARAADPKWARENDQLVKEQYDRMHDPVLIAANANYSPPPGSLAWGILQAGGDVIGVNA